MHFKCPTLSDFDPEMPWNAVIRSACEDLTCWHRNVDSPALEYTLGRGNRDSTRNSDTRAGASSSGGTHTGQQIEKRQQKPELPAGWKAHNTRGVEICRKWNSSPGGCELHCPQNRARQCAICLSTHRACQHDAGREVDKGAKVPVEEVAKAVVPRRGPARPRRPASDGACRRAVPWVRGGQLVD